MVRRCGVRCPIVNDGRGLAQTLEHEIAETRSHERLTKSHHQVLLRDIGFQRRLQTDYATISYAKVLTLPLILIQS